MGANLEIKDDQDKTPLDLAQSIDFKEAVDCLIIKLNTKVA